MRDSYLDEDQTLQSVWKQDKNAKDKLNRTYDKEIRTSMLMSIVMMFCHSAANAVVRTEGGQELNGQAQQNVKQGNLNNNDNVNNNEVLS